MIGSITSSTSTGAEPTPDPAAEQKWEFPATAGGIAKEQIVVTAVNGELVSYRRMSDGEHGSTTRDALRRDGSFVEMVEFDADDDWALP